MEEMQTRTIVLFLVVVISLGILYILPNPTGLTVYPTESLLGYKGISKVWNFSDAGDYVYNSSEVVISENQVSLKPITSNYSWYELTYEESVLLSVIYKEKEKINDLSAKDSKDLKVDKDNMLNIKFNKSLENNDIISIYLKSSSPSELYLCNANTECQSPGYGKVDYDGNEGWYNITLSGLSFPNNTFNLDPEDVKLDFIKAVHQIKTEKSSTNTSYKNSTVQTRDISQIKQIKSITFSQELNSQAIGYKYSKDKGLTWDSLPDNVSGLDVQEIRFSATLYSDEKSTPILKGITLVYDKIQPKLSFEIDKSGLINVSANIPVTINSSNFLLNVTTKQDVANANISIRKFTNASIEILNPLGEFMDIDIDESLKNSLDSVVIRIPYNEEDISSKNINESTLKLYYYNESDNTWIPLTSNVDVTNNIIEAALPHFSIYGVFGNKVNSTIIQNQLNQSQSNKTNNISKSISSIITMPETITETTESSQVSESASTDENKTEVIPEESQALNETQAAEEPSTSKEKEKGVTGFATYIGKVGMGNLIVLILGLSLLVVYAVYKISKKKKQPL
ncbi:hypothetical protein HY500_01470 [Candidatus Woesearchaeota archaeon]|nr:hypothetical protein [Candidatus Woesearchaeota archaeon]